MTRAISPLVTAQTDDRRALVNTGGAFAALADGLTAELEVLCDAPLPIPAFKARLTRGGGRCPVHGILLDFEPLRPHDHRCARCDAIYRGREHDEWWAMGAQLFTAERAVHAATLYALRGNTRHADLAARILRAYTEQYDTWPNRDNVLGPSRPFFSTYLESIWLLNLCHATALLETHAPIWTARDAQQLRDRVLVPSATLIDGYHEGRSNRQVWNEVALCSAWSLLGREDDARVRLAASTGLAGLIDAGLDADGFWYEGENYHMFAHRGMWYGVTLMQALGHELSPALTRRYHAGFIAPFLGVLPDETFPSRRDSQYASSLRQWRTAEWCELGWADTHDASLAAVLSSIYRPDGERLETGRRTSTADAERNWPGSRLTRADLSWRALLMADGATPYDRSVTDARDVAADAVQRRAPSRFAHSVAVPAHGLAVVRRDAGALYVALDGGRSGGGHGHPDQLSLTVQRGASRWLDDPGTGSYVEAKLAWYRSTLAHHAPFLDGRSQRTTRARLVAFHDEQISDDAGAQTKSSQDGRDASSSGLAWMVKSVDDLLPGTHVRRSIVVGHGYLVDCIEWQGDVVRSLTLPLIGTATTNCADTSWHASMDGMSTTDDPAWAFIRELSHATCAAPLEFHAPAFAARAEDDASADVLHGWYSASAPAVCSRARVPAAPGLGESSRLWLTSRAASGRMVGVLSWGRAAAAAVQAVQVSEVSSSTMAVRVLLASGECDTHEFAGGVWRAATAGLHTRELFVISDGLFTGENSVIWNPKSVMDERQPPLRIITLMRTGMTTAIRANEPVSDASSAESPEGGLCTLGAPNYVQTERPWHEAGAPTARLRFSVTSAQLVVDIAVHTGHPLTTTNEGENPLDNEPHATNADGVQWYMQAPSDAAGSHDERWEVAGIVATTADGAVLQRPLGVRPVVPEVTVEGHDEGWRMQLRWSLAALPVGEQGTLDVEFAINERPPERERRRGQLVLSGGGGFGYLAGARRPCDRYVRLRGVPRPSPASSA